LGFGDFQFRLGFDALGLRLNGSRRSLLSERFALSHFLIKLGVRAAAARIDAEGIEHHVSAETLAAMSKYLSRR
jgi:DtxR family manganese transport transcriptional regulator